MFEFALEQIRRTQFFENTLARFLFRHTARHRLFVLLGEMLRELFNDFCFAHGRQPQLRQPRSDFDFEIRHVLPP